MLSEQITEIKNLYSKSPKSYKFRDKYTKCSKLLKFYGPFDSCI